MNYEKCKYQNVLSLFVIGKLKTLELIAGNPNKPNCLRMKYEPLKVEG